MTGVQIFGVKNSQATRAAERFFKERAVAIHFVDLKQKPMAKGEMQRFVQKFGLAAMCDTEGKAWVDAGLRYMKMSDEELAARVAKDPGLLRLPLVRGEKRVSVGQDEGAWREMAGR